MDNIVNPEPEVPVAYGQLYQTTSLSNIVNHTITKPVTSMDVVSTWMEDARTTFCNTITAMIMMEQVF